MAKKKTTEDRGCKCLASANEQLAEQGMKLETALQINFKTGESSVAGPFMLVRWKDKPKRGKRLPLMVCNYCPMCGKKQ